MRRALWVCLAFLAVPLAGCSESGEADEPDLVDLGLQATATTGIIRGVVVDEAIRPVAGATITLRTQDNRDVTTTSHDSGAFGFDSLPPATYFMKIRKLGYHEVQQTADVVAGVAEPPVVKVLLAVDAAGIPYSVSLAWDGYVECGTDVLAVCAVPDFANQTACDAAGVCPGRINNDDFDQWHVVDGPPTYIQAEMAWESTQSVSRTFSLLLRAAEKDLYDTGYYEFSINGTEGPSPIMAGAHADDIEDAELGTRTGLITAIFSGAAEGNPAGLGGFVVQQRFTVFLTYFYGYTPPPGWLFTETGQVPQPV